MMTRRIVRSIAQLVAAVAFTIVVVIFLDRNYRVLPNSLHHHMPSHHPGHVVVDATIVKCSSLNPMSSCTLDPKIWHRVEKDLYLGKAWLSTAYLWVSRKHEEELTADDRVIMDVVVGRLRPTSKKENDDPWESRPGGIWVKRSSKKDSFDSDKAVTDLDLLYGDDAVEARPGWAITGTPLLLKADKGPSVQLTVRRGPHSEMKKPKPRIKDNGRFKILQLGDLHLSTDVGVCRDAVPDTYNGGPCEADPRTLDFVNRILDEEKPDFVVLSGDQVNGDTAPDAQTAIFKYAALLIERKIPYASIFGNHDDEKTMPREAQMALLETLPYSMSVAGPADIDGVGNYYVEILARGGSDHSAITIYLLDSHAYTPDERKFPGYDWIKPNQVEWFKNTADSLKQGHSLYTHTHMDIAFIHIPLPEYRDAELARVGEWKEGVTAPNFNSGFRDALVEKGVLMVSAGHDHCNDYCSLSTHADDKSKDDDKKKAADQAKQGDKSKASEKSKAPALWMCYAGGSGFGGYAGYGGYHRRVRLFEIDTNDARITTWKRLEYGDVAKRVDEQIIVDGGKPIEPRNV